MADIAIFRINYKSDFIITLESDAGWTTPFCIKFWTDSPQRAFYVQYDGETYTHCAPVADEPTKLSVQMDDHHLGVGDLKFQIAYHFTVADFPHDTEDEVINQAAVIIDEDGQQEQVMLDFNGETAPEIAFSLPAYANEAQRIANEEARIQNEETRISAEQVRQQNETQRIAREQARQNNESQRIEREQARQTNESQRIEREQARQTNESQRIEREQARQTNEELRIEREQSHQSNEEQRIANETERVIEFADIKTEAVDATNAANAAASLANENAQLADDKAQLADSAASLATAKAQLAQEMATYAQTQGDYAKAQGNTAQADHVRAEADHTTAAADHTQAVADTATAASDHTQAVADHTQAASDHTRAESDHTRAESDHAAVEVYVDSLGAFDISAYHATGGVLAKYADLTAALGTNGANIPDALRKGGISVKFVQSSDNKYIQARCMAQNFTTDITQWQGVDSELSVSDNLVDGEGIIKGFTDGFEYNINIAKLTPQHGYINTLRKKWSQTGQYLDKYSHYITEIPKNAKVLNVVSGANDCTLLFLDVYTYNGQDDTRQDYLHLETISADTEKQIDIESTWKYLYILRTMSQTVHTPSSVKYAYNSVYGEIEDVKGDIAELQNNIDQNTNDILQLHDSVMDSVMNVDYSKLTLYKGALDLTFKWISNNDISKNAHYVVEVRNVRSVHIVNNDEIVGRVIFLRTYYPWEAGKKLESIKEFNIEAGDEITRSNLPDDFKYIYIEKRKASVEKALPAITININGLDSIVNGTHNNDFDDVITQPGKLYALNAVNGEFNVLNRIYPEGVLKEAIKSAKIDGQPFVIAESLDSSSISIELTADEYNPKKITIPIQYVNRTILANKNPKVLLIGDSLTDNGLSAVVKFIFNSINKDSLLVGTREDNLNLSLGDYSSYCRSYNEGRSGRATSDQLRHLITVTATKANWDMLGLATMTRNGTQGRAERVDYTNTAENNHQMAVTCHGYYDADPSQELWTLLTGTFGLTTFVQDGVTYTFHNSYTAEDNAAQIAGVKYLCQNPNKYWDANKFYDYATVQSSDGFYAFNLGVYLSRWKTLANDGETRLIVGDTAGSYVTNVEAFDLCEPTHIVFISVANDGRLSSTGVESATDAALIASLIHNYNSSIEVLIGVTRTYGAFNPAAYSNIGLINSFTPSQRYIDAKEKLQELQTDASNNFDYLELYASQSPFGTSGGKAFDTLNLREIDRFVGDGLHAGFTMGYLDRAYQIVAWIASTY